MKLKKNIGFINILFLIFFYICIFLILSFSKSTVLDIFVYVIVSLYFLLFQYNIYYENEYLYFKKNFSNPNSLKDNPVKISDIVSYSENIPYFIFNGWCLSTKNIKLKLKNNKNYIFSVKNQNEIKMILEKNNIPLVSKYSLKNIIETSILVLISLIISSTYIYRLFTNNTSQILYYCILSFINTVFWIFSLIYGMLKERNQKKISDKGQN